MIFSSVRVATAAISVVNALSSTLQLVTDFDATPTKAKMYIYVPTKKVPNPPILVVLHHCQGSGPLYFTENPGYPQQADKTGCIIIYPTAPSTGTCFDVSSIQSLTHDGGGDSQTIVNMVKYTVKKYGADPDRVFATGGSSGAMMTNVLAGAYPDVFKAGTVYGGVPDGCFYLPSSKPNTSPPGWNAPCAQGKVSKTAQQWGDQVRSFYANYTGPRTRLQIWHGTIDNILRYEVYPEMLKEWSNVLNVTFTGNETNTPAPGYTKQIYGDGTKLLGFSAQGVGHTPPPRPENDFEWFGIS